MQLLFSLSRNLFIKGPVKCLTSLAMGEKPLETAIRQKLTEKLSPQHLDVINESYMHNVPPGTESHFKVVVVSYKFENLPLIQRHRLVNEALDYELKNGLHALSITNNKEYIQEVGEGITFRYRWVFAPGKKEPLGKIWRFEDKRQRLRASGRRVIRTLNQAQTVEVASESRQHFY